MELIYKGFMQRKTVAAFDFDGTLTKRDTFLPFALFVVGPLRWLKGLTGLLPYVLLFMIRRLSRQQLKELVIAEFIGGMTCEELELLSQEFAEEIIPKLLKSRALEQLRWHQEQGHHVVLVSASPDLYLLPWAKMMGIEDVCASQLEVNNGRITGKLRGLNCRGAEKVKRLQKLLGNEKTYELYAYGDSPGDRELLAYADHRFFRKI